MPSDLLATTEEKGSQHQRHGGILAAVNEALMNPEADYLLGGR
jgi:hypothetical protein